MRQVLDGSAVAALLLDGGAAGDWCRDRALEGSVVAPHLVQVEAANVIRRARVRGAIDETTGQRALERLMWMPLELVPFDVLARRAWNLKDNLTTYDACYVAAAEQFEVRLVTLDARLAAAPDVRCEVLVGPTSSG